MFMRGEREAKWVVHPSQRGFSDPLPPPRTPVNVAACSSDKFLASATWTWNGGQTDWPIAGTEVNFNLYFVVGLPNPKRVSGEVTNSLATGVVIEIQPDQTRQVELEWLVFQDELKNLKLWFFNLPGLGSVCFEVAVKFPGFHDGRLRSARVQICRKKIFYKTLSKIFPTFQQILMEQKAPGIISECLDDKLRR